MLQHFEWKAQNSDQNLAGICAHNVSRKFENIISGAFYIKFSDDIVNGIFESFGIQLLFRSEFFLHCWIAEGFELYFLSFLQDCDQKNNFSRIPNTINVSRIPHVGRWFILWFPFPHDSILILSLKGRQQLAWLMSSKECLATLPNQGRLCKKKMHFCIVEAWVWHSIKGLGRKLLVSPHPIPNFSFKVQRELYIFFTLLVIGR